MFNGDAALPAVAVYAPEPVLHAVVELDFRTVFRESLFSNVKFPPCLLHHGEHIGKVHIHVVFLGELVRLPPEFVHVLAHRLYEALRLHVARGQRSVEIIAYGKHRLFALFKPFIFHSDYLAYIISERAKNCNCLRQFCARSRLRQFSRPFGNKCAVFFVCPAIIFV